jgi:hypothetical protein
LGKDEKGKLLADSYIMNRWENYFSWLLNLNKVADFKKMEIHKSEPLLPEPCPFKDERIGINNYITIKFWHNCFE